MKFLESFAEKPVRETGGSRSSNRFDYQKNWSLCELLELHAKYNDYLMVFEHHDDVVVFDSQNNPSNAIFYQVKSKSSGNWTVGALTKGKDRKPSILEKLYGNYLSFPENIERLVFTSNQPFSAKLSSGEKSVDLRKVTFQQLSTEEKEKIQNCLEPSSQNHCNLYGLSKIETERNSLRVEDHTTTTKGKLVEFFENLQSESEINVSLVYKTFFDEIRRKSNYEKPINQLSDLVRYKSISKSDFDNMIGTVTKRVNDADLWQEASNALNSEKYSFQEIRRIKSEWQQYIVNKMNVTDELHLTLIADIHGMLKSNIHIETIKQLSETISSVLSKKHSENYDSDYIKAATIYEVLRNDPIQKVNSELTEEAK